MRFRATVPSLIRYIISYTQTVLVIMVFRETVFCMMNWINKKCVLAPSENRKSGPAASV